MNLINRTLQIDADTDARLHKMAAVRGQEVAAVLSEAVALLDSVSDRAGLEITEDHRRRDELRQNRHAVALNDVTAWVASWRTADVLPRPQRRKIG
jgi:hypothetical protein